MNHHGIPTHLFSTNRWVTGETFFKAEDVIDLLPRFEMGETEKAPETSLWVTSMMTLFRPQIEQLLILRDEAIEARRDQTEGSGKDVFEDRRVELTSICEISVLEQLEWLGLLDD
ncbi:MAG: hypothetical protein R3360_01505, partial [Alphaproteobacteria bacterium]|nr:hypothetical protein [Alphaproteobacteria bacterium]